MISIINNTQVDDTQYIDAVIAMYNLLEYSDNYAKISEILWQYCRDEPALANDGTIDDFTEANVITDSFKVKDKITGQSDMNGTKNVETIVPLKYLQ